MEWISYCPLCCSEGHRILVQGPDRLHGIQGDFSLVQCRSCGLIYQNPRPSAEGLAAYYPQDYFPYVRQNKPHSLLIRLGWRYGYEMTRRCRAIAKHKAGGKLIDVGCAHGVFLSSIRDFGSWEVWGVEINPEASQYARQEFSLDVYTGTLEEAGFPARFFDVVTLWDVLEHLPDPIGSLQEIHRILKPDGILVVGVPNVKSVDARIFGKYWIGLDLPRHLYVFSPQTLEQVLNRTSFAVVDIQYVSGSHYSFLQSLRFVLADKITNPRLRAVATDLTYALALRIILMPYLLLMERLGRGPIMTVFAHKAAK